MGRNFAEAEGLRGGEIEKATSEASPFRSVYRRPVQMLDDWPISAGTPARAQMRSGVQDRNCSAVNSNPQM
jgi:hypothetical protein